MSAKFVNYGMEHKIEVDSLQTGASSSSSSLDRVSG